MTTTDRRDADDATFTAEMDRPDRLEVADEDTARRLSREIGQHWSTGTVSTRRDDGATRVRHVCACGDQYAALADHLAAKVLAALKPAPGTDSSGQMVVDVLRNGEHVATLDAVSGSVDTSGQAVRRDQVRALRKTAWDMGYRSCQLGDQMHTNPYARAAVAGPQRDQGGEGGQ